MKWIVGIIFVLCLSSCEVPYSGVQVKVQPDTTKHSKLVGAVCSLKANQDCERVRGRYRYNRCWWNVFDLCWYKKI